jgi:hypothetical protein
MASRHTLSSLLCAGLLSMCLAGCSKDAPTADPAPPSPADAPAPPPVDDLPAPSGEVPPPDSAEPAPSPTPEPPPPTEPSAVPKPTALDPALDSMHAATASAKISVPVDLRYQFDSDPLLNQPVTLHLAAIPRVAGAKLRVTIKNVEGIRVAAGPMEIQKAAATSAYRQQLSVTRTALGPDTLRVLVTMEMAEGNGFGYFSIPLVNGKTAQKQHSVKQR